MVIWKKVHGHVLTVLEGTLRTKWTDPAHLRYRDLSAVEMAQALGYVELVHILSPVIRHNVPGRTLHAVQAQFHILIQDFVADEVLVRNLRLPELCAITELEKPIMWFPIRVDVATQWVGGFTLCQRHAINAR